MSTLIRTGISLDSELLLRFDRVIRKKGYTNRSEAIRDLVRDYAVAEDVEENRTVVGTLTMVYDHHRPKLSEQLIEAQHHAEGQSAGRHARPLGSPQLPGSNHHERA